MPPAANVPPVPDRPSASDSVAAAVGDAYAAYRLAFDEVTARARARFSARDWRGLRADARERIGLRLPHVRAAADAVVPLVAGRRDVWVAARRVYAEQMVRRPDHEIAETFFNSVARRVFGTAGVDDQLEFVWFGPTLPAQDDALHETFAREGDTARVLERVLRGRDLGAPWADLERDVADAARRLDEYVRDAWDAAGFDAVDVLRPTFYRHRLAWLVGRVRHRERVTPLLLSLRHDAEGVALDAVLVTENEASRAFSFAESYFHVHGGHPSGLVAFLKSILPAKPDSELYTGLGHHKHGKTVLYRSLYRHLDHSLDRFVPARGAEGMVMIVFVLPGFDVAFKVIRDRFEPPKTGTRREVAERYDWAFEHERVGRLVDAQEFENLTFDRDRFAPDLLARLLREAASVVHVDGSTVTVSHVYTERRVYPLDLYLAEMPFERAASAVADWGRAVRDLASAGVFPGDLFAKNFGVTRHGRVVFYDYDELQPLTDLEFRAMPSSPDYDNELEAEPWFTVGPRDVFPAEFPRFLRLPPRLADVMAREHAELFTPEYWREAQRRAREDEAGDDRRTAS